MVPNHHDGSRGPRDRDLKLHSRGRPRTERILCLAHGGARRLLQWPLTMSALMRSSAALERAASSPASRNWDCSSAAASRAAG